MRITGGEYRGRRLRSPRGERVRPTQDRVREALFAMLAAEVRGARFLDLYAGTGAVGLEALSRGAAEVVWVEEDPRACRLARANVSLLSGGTAEVICADVMRWLEGAGRGRRFDIVFADPPYGESRQEGLSGLAARLRAVEAVAPGGFFAAELPAAAAADVRDGWRLWRDRAYGRTRLLIARRVAEE